MDPTDPTWIGRVNVMPTNPFHFNTPTRLEDFLGRGTIVSEIADALYLSHDSFGIVGGRRFGKSSMLLALENQLAERLEEAEIGDCHVLPVFVSLDAIELTSPFDVLGFVLHKIKKATSGKKTPIPLFEEPLLELGLPEYTEITSSPTNVQELEEAIKDVVSAAYLKVGLLRIALLIDETDCTLGFPWTGTLFGMLRSLIYSSSVREHVRLILAGSGRYLDANEKGSPLFNAITSCFLESFTEDAVYELVNRVDNIPPVAITEVMWQGGGHPFILQHLLHYLVKGDVASLTKEDVHAEVRRFIHNRSSDLEGWWQAIGDDGRRVYCILAQATGWITHAELSRAANDPHLQIDRGLKALCYHGTAIHDGTYQKYRISGHLFRDWSLSRCTKDMITKPTAQVFLSYARPDAEKVESLYQKLSNARFKPWMDKKDILPGEIWQFCIRKAIRHSDFFLVCLTANSIDKRGWIQREIKQALDIWQEKLDSDIYLIPARLEDCEVPGSLRDFQWVNLFEEDGWTQLVKAIQEGMERR